MHDFNFSPKTPDPVPRVEPVPVVAPRLENQPNTNRSVPINYDPTNVTVEDVNEVFPVGFETMDRGVKDFFSDIQVPTKDGVKPLTVRVAGGDKTILFWKQDLSTGRVELPIMSVNRSSWSYNPARATPVVGVSNFYRRFADKDGTRMVQTGREIPYLIDYTLSIWANRKRDIEYILYQIQVRFDPMAEWSVEDEYMCGQMFATFEGGNDNSDIDIDPNQWAKVRYDVNIKVEGWLPRSGRVTPTVLGKVTTLDEIDTREFFGIISKNNPRGI